MTYKWPQGYVDHINGDGLDNSWSNLREVTFSEKLDNRRKNIGSRSRYVGVRKRSEGSRYSARIKKDGKEYSLGVFNTDVDAHIAYVKAKKKLFGEFTGC